MATKDFRATVMRALIEEHGRVMVRFRVPEWNPQDQWHVVEPGTPGASLFMSIALTCLATGLPADVTVEDPAQEFSPLVRLQIVRA